MQVSFGIPSFSFTSVTPLPAGFVMKVMITLGEQLSKAKQQQLANRVLSDVKHSYLSNMDSLASAISQEVRMDQCLSFQLISQEVGKYYWHNTTCRVLLQKRLFAV